MKKLIQLLTMWGLLIGSVQATTLQNDEKKVVMHIKEMTCQLCVYLVNKELRNVEGVLHTKANIKERNVNILAKNSVDNESLKQAIYKLNYSAEIVE
ncbi:heavy-metal-associated domain-containing protein [Pasteurellaceae bacterium 22721_9_1]